VVLLSILTGAGTPRISAATPNPGAAEATETTSLVQKINQLPLQPPTKSALPSKPDWLLQPAGYRARISRSADGKQLVLSNGLVRRVFRATPNLATVGLDNLMTDTFLLRAVKPEALITLNGVEYPVGGLAGQPEPAYLLPEWLDGMSVIPHAFQCVGVEIGEIEARFPWKRVRSAEDRPWPPPGVSLQFTYAPPAGANLKGISLTIHYELYDGLPVMAKWMTLTNESTESVRVDTFTAEILAPAEVESAVDDRAIHQWRLPGIQLFSDYTFHGMDLLTANRTTEWLPDPTYTSQVHYQRAMPALVVSRPPLGPDQIIPAGESFSTFRTWILVYDSDDRERQGLAIRRTYRTLAPWVTENPLMMHVRSADRKSFRAAVDQCAAVGFEMVIYTFGSGLNMENTDPGYLRRIREDVDYAHARGIEVGAYSLLASRRISDAVDVINPETGKPGGAIFGNSPCLATDWGKDYFRRIRHFIETTGFDLLEHDGSYPGDVCASTHHSGHHGLLDSQWNQWEMIRDLYEWCRTEGIYLNVPDHYMLNGSSKTGMGYRETNWSLPRERQIVLGRQNIFDGTWTKTPSMGWMFVPLTEYHGGGAAATLEPLQEHLDAYQNHLINNLSAGVQACYRGPRLYDSPETRDLVAGWVAWFKKHRAILESDVIHLRRANGRDWDGLLHVNPRLDPCGMAVIYNPLPYRVEREIVLPLYFTGLKNKAVIRIGEEPAQTVPLDSDQQVRISLKLPANGFNWCELEAP